MEQGHMDAFIRDGLSTQALRQLRETGSVPGILYGGDAEAIPVAVPEQALRRSVAASHLFVELGVGGERVSAHIHDVQRDPLTKAIVHVDFYRVDESREADLEVPIHLHGTDKAKKHGSIVQQQIRTLSIRALPKDAPEYISLDVSALEPGEHLTVADLVLPPNIKLRSETAEVLVTALAPSQVVVVDAIEEPRESAAAGQTESAG